MEVDLAELILEGVQVDALLRSTLKYSIDTGLVSVRSFESINLLTGNLLLNSGSSSFHQFLLFKRNLVVSGCQLLFSPF